VSDVVGYVLAFAVILASVGLVSTFGINALETVRENQQENNAEGAFDVMAENFDEIEQNLAPSRTAEVDLHDGRMSVQNVTEFAIRVEHDQTKDFVERVHPKRIVLQPDLTSQNIITYVNGATIRGQNGTQQGVIQNNPQMVCNGEQVVVSMVTLNTSEDRQLGGGTVRITGTEKDTRLIYPVNRTGQNSSTNVSDDFEIRINGGFERAWRKALVQSDEQNWERGTGDTIVCPDPKRVFVRETVITVTFVR
jgi:hypothetical protein